MEQRKGTAATRAKNKYNAENYDRLYPYVKRGKKEKYQRAAEAAGCSPVSYTHLDVYKRQGYSWAVAPGFAT